MSTGLSARLLTGDSGSGKTSLAATFAEWVWRRFHKVTRLATADGGGWGSKMERLVQLGIVEAFRMRTRAGAGSEGLMEETVSLAAKGWWPERFSSVERGEVLPGTRMLPPVVTSFKLLCPAGHVALQVDRQPLLRPAQCPTCKQAVTLQTGKVERHVELAPHMDKIGAEVFESITSISGWQLGSLADRRARLELHGEKSNIGRFLSGEVAFDGNNRGDYSLAQANIEKWILDSTAIPGLVESPLWTGLETQVEETGKALPMYAPAIAGQARSGQVPTWVGDWLGIVQVRTEKGGVERRLMLSPHLEQDGTPHKYKVRAEPGFLPLYLSDGDGAPFTSFNLGVYLDMVYAANEKSLAESKKEFADAPGVKQQAAVPVVTPSSVPAAAQPAAAAPAAAPRATAPVGRMPTARPGAAPSPAPRGSLPPPKPPAAAPGSVAEKKS